MTRGNVEQASKYAVPTSNICFKAVATGLDMKPKKENLESTNTYL